MSHSIPTKWQVSPSILLYPIKSIYWLVVSTQKLCSSLAGWKSKYLQNHLHGHRLDIEYCQPRINKPWSITYGASFQIVIISYFPQLNSLGGCWSRIDIVNEIHIPMISQAPYYYTSHTCRNAKNIVSAVILRAKRWQQMMIHIIWSRKLEKNLLNPQDRSI